MDYRVCGLTWPNCRKSPAMKRFPCAQYFRWPVRLFSRWPAPGDAVARLAGQSSFLWQMRHADHASSRRTGNALPELRIARLSAHFICRDGAGAPRRQTVAGAQSAFQKPGTARWPVLSRPKRRWKNVPFGVCEEVGIEIANYAISPVSPGPSPIH